MRARWHRPVPAPTPGEDDVAAMIRAALPDACVAGVTGLDGGLANTNIRVDLDRAPHRVVLRLYQRDARQAGKEAAIARRLGGAVPVARFLHSGEHGGRHYAVLDWIDGERLDTALTDTSKAAALGRATGVMLARIHAIPFERSGFLDAQLRVAGPFVANKAFLIKYLRGAFIEGGGARFVPRDLADAVIAAVDRAGDSDWGGPACLVHGDYNGSNILMRGDEIAAVLD